MVQKVFTILDQEIATLKLNINQLAGITGVNRQMVAARLKNVEPAPGSNSKLKLYLVTDILTELMIPTVSANIDDMPPSDRLSHWKAENERLKFEQDIKSHPLTSCFWCQNKWPAVVKVDQTFVSC